LRKNAIFSPKIGENRDHNINPLISEGESAESSSEEGAAKQQQPAAAGNYFLNLHFGRKFGGQIWWSNLADNFHSPIFIFFKFSS
jgi:hypothetical protein